MSVLGRQRVRPHFLLFLAILLALSLSRHAAAAGPPSPTLAATKLVVTNPHHRRQGQQHISLQKASSPAIVFPPVRRRLQRLGELLARTNNGTRLAMAGALAGGFSNLVLYPIDVAKTLRQAGAAYKGVSLVTQARAYGLGSLWAGLTPAIFGSMPSSALYFGVYEHMKRWLNDVVPVVSSSSSSSSLSSSSPNKRTEHINQMSAQRAQVARRWLVHALAAAAGNTASSLVFVPKEVLKQQLQTYRNSHGGAASTLPQVLATILRERGIRGLYSGYRATLLRNIPSAILRFALYEEFKLFLGGHNGVPAWLNASNAAIVAGALAGALSSAATTPLDVVKTRMAVNACPSGGDVLSCLVDVAQREGVPGLYAGLGFRVLYSALFTAVGFSSFEASKALLGVGDPKKGQK